MNDDEACPFCEIVHGEDPDAREVYRDDRAIAFLPPEPATLGHTLIVPRRHIPDVWSLDEETAAHLARVTLILSHAVRRALGPDGLNVIQSNGAAATQSVFHLHIHIVPRWTDDDMGRIWPLEASYSELEKNKVWEELRDECRKLGEDDDAVR
jgi:histidine triad (HIT) family protein